MEEPRPRFTYHKIIDKSKLKSPWRYFVEGSITLAFWAIWVYWLYPVATVLLWILGINIFYQELFSHRGFFELVNILQKAGIIFLVIMIVILGWSYYNYFWFLRRGERRNKKVVICHDEDFARLFNVDAELLKEAKKCSQLEVTLQDKTVIIRCGGSKGR